MNFFAQIWVGVALLFSAFIGFLLGFFHLEQSPVSTIFGVSTVQIFQIPQGSTLTLAGLPWIPWPTLSSTGTPPYLYYTEENGELYANAVEPAGAGAGARHLSAQLISGVDPISFAVAQNGAGGSYTRGYAKDNANVYYIYIGSGAEEGDVVVKTIPGADPASFTVFGYGVPSPDADAPAIPEAYAEDEHHVYDCSFSMANGTEECGPIANADVSTFKVLSSLQDPTTCADAYDAQDAHARYLYGRAVPTSGIVVVYDPDCTPTEYEKDANYIYLNDGSGRPYAGMVAPSDFSAVYPADYFMTGVDAASFISLGGGYFADNRQVYYDDKGLIPIEGADPGTFAVIAVDSRPYSKDKHDVYFYSNAVKGADPNTFMPIQTSFFSEDQAHVYFDDTGYARVAALVQGANPATFTPLAAPDGTPSDYGEDDTTIYCGASPMPADLATFVVTGKSSARDKDNAYAGCDVDASTVFQ